MDSRSLRAALDGGDTIVLDGGLATQLEAQGADLSDELWSARLLVEDPGAILAAHLAYFRAGARIATTASYQATFEGFERRGIGRDDATVLLRRSVELAAAARDTMLEEHRSGPERYIAASIGPFGAMLADGSEYRGRYGRTVEQLRDFHRERLEVLFATDADVLAVETIPEIEEAAAVAQLVAATPDAAAWVSFSCADGRRIRSGAPIEDAVAAVAFTPGILAVGVNCTAPEHVTEARGADDDGDLAPRNGVPEQRRGVGRHPTRMDRRPGYRRRRGCRAPMDRRRCTARGRLLPGDTGPGRVDCVGRAVASGDGQPAARVGQRTPGPRPHSGLRGGATDRAGRRRCTTPPGRPRRGRRLDR